MGRRRVQSGRLLRGRRRSGARRRLARMGDGNHRGASVAARAVSARDAAGGMGRRRQRHALIVIRAYRQGTEGERRISPQRALVVLNRMRPLSVGEPRRHRGRRSKSRARRCPIRDRSCFRDRDYKIDDNWRVAGLSGTGSKDIVVDDAFVPEHHSQSHWDYAMGRDLPDGSSILRHCIASIRHRFQLCADSLGARRRARLSRSLDRCLVARARAASAASSSEDPDCQSLLSECTYAIEGGFLAMRHDFERVDGGRARPVVRFRFSAAPPCATTPAALRSSPPAPSIGCSRRAAARQFSSIIRCNGAIRISRRCSVIRISM